MEPDISPISGTGGDKLQGDVREVRSAWTGSWWHVQLGGVPGLPLDRSLRAGRNGWRRVADPTQGDEWMDEACD